MLTMTRPAQRETQSALGLRNRFLLAVPESLRRRLLLHAARVALKKGETVDHPAEKPRFAYFPESAVISALNVMENGKSIEVGSIGREGVSGVLAAWGMDFIPHRYIVQIPGTALRMSIGTLAKALSEDVRMRQLVLRYYVAFSAQVMQSVACVGLHTVESRCCRWLLETHDRVDSDRFSLTHEYLSAMLGTRRASVSEVLARIQRRGVIQYRRGVIAVLQRDRLEASACECYGLLQTVYRRLLGPVSTRAGSG